MATGIDRARERDLKVLVAHPHFQRALQSFKTDKSDPVSRVRKAVHAAALPSIG
jgi:hypothetical protein